MANMATRGPDVFAAYAPRLIADLMQEFGVSRETAAAAVGNLAHESDRFRAHQEYAYRNDRGALGRGGMGWPQWTNSRGSPRRAAFSEYVERTGLAPGSYEANFGFLISNPFERGLLQKSLNAAENAKSLPEKTRVFERSFERARVPAWSKRTGLAGEALKVSDQKDDSPEAGWSNLVNSVVGGDMTAASEAEFSRGLRTGFGTAPSTLTNLGGDFSRVGTPDERAEDVPGEAVSASTRNNNPGAMKYASWQKAYGGVKGSRSPDGVPYARFPTPAAGFAASAELQRRYEGQGRTTIAQRVAKWTGHGSGGADTASDAAYRNYVAALTGALGIDANTPFSISDPVLGPAYLNKMAEIEAGQTQPFAPEELTNGMQMFAQVQAGGVGAGLSAPSMATIPPGEKGRIASQQMALKAAGYDPGPIDGIVGPLTQKAAQAYLAAGAPQSDTALAFTGDAPSDAQAAINDYLALNNPGIVPASLPQAAAVPDQADQAIPDVTTPPSLDDIRATPTGADEVVRATMEGDPAHLTSAWNDLVKTAAFSPAKQAEAKNYMATIAPTAKMAMARSIAWDPSLLKSVPALGMPGQPTMRDTARTLAEDTITGGHAAEQAGMIPSKTAQFSFGDKLLSTPVYDDQYASPSPAEQPTKPYIAASSAPTKDPLQSVSDYSRYSSGPSIATIAPPTVKPDEYAGDLSESQSYAMSDIVGSPVALPVAAEPMAYTDPPASIAAAPPPKQENIATISPTREPTRLNKLFGAPGMQSYSGVSPIAQSVIEAAHAAGYGVSPGTPAGYNAPNFSSGSGGAVVAYKPNVDANGNPTGTGTYINSYGQTMTY